MRYYKYMTMICVLPVLMAIAMCAANACEEAVILTLEIKKLIKVVFVP